MDLIQVSNTPGMQVLEDEFIALKPMCDALGIDSWSQIEKLKARSWATTRKIPVVAADGKTREMTALHKDAVPMWLATLSENKVKPEARPTLIAYQREATQALNNYFNHKNQPPTSTPLEPTDHPEITRQKILQQKLHTLDLAAAYIDELQIQARAWMILEQINPDPTHHQPPRATLTITNYLTSLGLPKTTAQHLRQNFARHLLEEYTQTHGHLPKRRHGHYHYTTADRPLMDTAYQRMNQNLTW
ncbi:phage antirepressor N-terminal domain-containing protein [Rothia nasimurium]|uniref:phage antirepressor N-terminal domain-containing protein n=1 Tax=Rothia nasimurium TaxID=85336 RepID=UPI003BA262E8